MNRYEYYMGHGRTAPPAEIEKSGSVRLCGLLPNTVLQSFSSISRNPRDVY